MKKLRRLLFVLLILPLSSQAMTAPDFELPGLDGMNYRLSDFKGKWVLVNFWATWCPPCLEEIPELEIFHSNHFRTDAVVLGVNAENIAPAKLKQFVDDQFISYPILMMQNSKDSPFGRLPGLPTSFLISPEGEVVARQVGTVTASGLENFMKSYKR